ncbi:hypothetical protein FACS189437_09280 [Bacteroidia bacterium]|nr:hypothetical protein FACS189437_09280 [Bacteroidia bacterium]
MERKIILTEEVELFYAELLIVLFEKGYFSFLDNAKLYVDRLIRYVEQYIGIISGKNAPSFYDHYGTNLKYITYRANKNTWWYIFYQQHDNVFLIRHITNNHVAAQYFDN